MPADFPNKLVSSVSRPKQKAFLAQCEEVEMAFGETLTDSFEMVRHVYFPTTGFISLMAPDTAAATGLEVGLVGNEGMLGAEILLDVGEAPLRAVVQGAGMSLRMAPAAFRAQAQRSPALARLARRYIFTCLVQHAQNTACNRFHVVEARLARWILMTQDRAHTTQFRMTHEFLASMLGVRRVGVTQAASALQKRGLIGYHRGVVLVLDRRSLEKAACSCYEADNRVYHRLMD